MLVHLFYCIVWFWQKFKLIKYSFENWLWKIQKIKEREKEAKKICQHW
jgi:hypothetical protein